MPTIDSHVENGRIGFTCGRPLPPELIAEVFYFCLPSDDERLSMPANRLAPLTLSWVCSYWRKLCLKNPRLWADIVLGYHDHEVARELPLLELFLSRTGTHPISFKHIAELADHLRILLDEKQIETYSMEMHEILERVCSRAEQLQVMVLNVLDVAAANPVLSAIQRVHGPSSQAACPLLEELRISTTHLGQSGECFVLQNLDKACPNLKVLSLFSPMMAPSPYTLPMQNLRCLELMFCTSINYCMQWLDATPALEILKIRLFCRALEAEAEESDDDGWTIVNVRRRPSLRNLARQNIRKLERLKHLDVRGFSSAVDVGILLDMLYVPALRHLEVSTLVMSSEKWPYVIDLIDRSAPALEYLKLSGTPMKSPDIVRCLRMLPKLKRLGVGKLKDADALFRALTIHVYEASPTAADMLCPQLEALDVANSNGSVDLVAGLITSRCVPEADERGETMALAKLKEVEVDGQLARSLRDYPEIATCISRGLALTEERSSFSFDLRGDH